MDMVRLRQQGTGCVQVLRETMQWWGTVARQVAYPVSGYF